MRVRRILLLLVALVVLAYGGAMVWLVANETRIVFQAGRPLSAGRPDFPYQQIDLPRADGARQFAWSMPHGGSPTWVLFLHGNAATVASRVNISHYTRLRELGTSVLAPEYRGYAGLDGVPSETSVDADARAGYEFLRDRLHVPIDHIVIYGWSLGAAVAVDLASEVPSAAVILEGAPASLVDIGHRRYPFFPIRLLMRNPFDSIGKIDRIHAPMLFIHSPEDVVIPIDEGRRLFAAARTEKTFVEVRGGHVDSADTDPAVFFDAVRGFLAAHHLVPRRVTE